MAVTARTWVPSELVSASKMNTLRDDILELDAVAGFNNAQYGTITLTGTNQTADATVSAMSARAIIHNLGWGTPQSTSPGVRLSKVNSTTIRATRFGNDDLSSSSVVIGFAVEDPRG